MWSGRTMPGQSTVCSGKSGISIDHRSVLPSSADARLESTRPRPSSLDPETKKPPDLPAASSSSRGDDQCEQPLGDPVSSAVRKLEPQPHAATALGLLTVKPAP